MPQKINLSKEDLDVLINAYVNLKQSTREISEGTGLRKDVVNRLLKEAGVEIRKSGRPDSGFNQTEYSKTYYEKNKSKLNDYRTEWGKENKNKINLNHSNWRNENREKLNEKNRKYEKKKREDGVYRFKCAIKSGVWETLTTNRTTSIWSHMPYTLNDLITHLESLFTPGMSWDNYGEWHIDHIKPQSKFIFTDFKDEQFLECWGLNNLQPLWATTREIDGIIYQGNLNKNNKFIDSNPIPNFDINISGNSFHSTVPVVNSNFFPKRRTVPLMESEINEICELYKSGETGIAQLAHDFRIAKKKVKEVLRNNNIVVHKPGHVPTSKTKDGDEKYKEALQLKADEGKMYILICKTTGKMFKDYLNKAGSITRHMRNIHNINEPNHHFKKQFYLDNDKHWFSDYFELKQIDYFGNN